MSEAILWRLKLEKGSSPGIQTESNNDIITADNSEAGGFVDAGAYFASMFSGKK